MRDVEGEGCGVWRVRSVEGECEGVEDESVGRERVGRGCRG